MKAIANSNPENAIINVNGNILQFFFVLQFGIAIQKNKCIGQIIIQISWAKILLCLGYFVSEYPRSSSFLLFVSVTSPFIWNDTTLLQLWLSGISESIEYYLPNKVLIISPNNKVCPMCALYESELIKLMIKLWNPLDN